MKKLKAVLAALSLVLTVFLVMLVSPVSAGAELDQYQESQNWDCHVNPTYHYAQSFKPTYAELTYVQLYMHRFSGTPNEVMGMHIRSSLTGANLRSSYESAGVLGLGYSWHTFTLSSNLVVTPEQTYYIVLEFNHGASGTDIVWGGLTSDNYARGQLWEWTGGSWTGWSGWETTFRTFGWNDAPLEPWFSTATSTGCLNTNYLYVLEAVDPDEYEYWLQYRMDWDDTGWGIWYDFGNEHNSGGNTLASVNLYHSWASEYIGNIRAQVKDDDDELSPIYYYYVNMYNHAPVLSNGDVDPHVGDQSTPFYFEVKYQDCDGDAPTSKWLYHHIQGYTWSNVVMTPRTGGSYQTGKWFDSGPWYYSHDGTGEYYFVFNDGTNTDVRLPSSGYYTFTVSTNTPPNTISSEDISFTPTSFYRGEEVTFHASTTDPDGDNIRYGWNWDEDGTVDDWTGYYPSGSQCTQTHTYGFNDFDGVGGETLPVVVKVKADDGNGGVIGFTSKAISLLNHDPNSTTVYGPTEIQKDVEGTWNLTISDPETDQMWVKFAWGDGTADTNTDWNASGSNVSASHIYTSRGLKTITCTITDEFAGTRVVYKALVVEDVPEPPTNIQSSAYHQMIHVTWSKPTDDGGEPVSSYGIKWWNASLSEDTATFVYEISYLNASEYDNTGHNITGLDNDQQYNFRMSCNNTYGMSTWSDIYNNTPGHTSPTAPVLQPLPEYSDTVLDLEWSEPTFYDGAIIDKYYLLNSTDNINYYALGNTTQRTYHVTNLENGVTYYFKVYAVDNQSAQSPNSAYRFTFIDDINPTEPILDDLSVYTYGLTVSISWSASTDASSGINYYVLQEDDSSTFSSPTNTYEGSSLNKTFSSNHQYSKTYYYRVRAIDKAGNPSEWNGPVQTTLRINVTTGVEYSKISEIWFAATAVVINQPIIVTISVEDRYSIPSGFVHCIVGTVETEMRLSAISGNLFKFNAVWQPIVSGDIDFQVKVVNSNNAANMITIPIGVLTTNKTVNPSVLVFETADEDIVTATFSETSLNVSAYRDTASIYHVTFGTPPDETVMIDLTELEPQLEPGYLWFIRVDWLDSYQLRCMVHGHRKIIQYKIGGREFTVDGYNDLGSTLFGWVFGTDFVLVEKSADHITLSSVEKMIIVKY